MMRGLLTGSFSPPFFSLPWLFGSPGALQHYADQDYNASYVSQASGEHTSIFHSPQLAGLVLNRDFYSSAAANKDSSNGSPPRILPPVGAFSVQCSLCLKWRLIPTKELYEQIRQFISENPFSCSRASSWRPNACCDDPSDLSQDASHVWAIDQPNIPVAPMGWERLIVLRAEGSSKFADVYYKSPRGRRLRSMPEVERYLEKHPEYVNTGVTLSQFSFVKPKPLHRGYVRKKNVVGRMRGSILPKKPCNKE